MSDVVEMLKCLRLGRSLWQKEIKTCQKLLSPEVSQNLNSVQRISAIQQISHLNIKKVDRNCVRQPVSNTFFESEGKGIDDLVQV